MGRISLQLKVLLVLALGMGTLLAVLSLVAVTALKENTERSLQEHLSVAQSAAAQLDLLLDHSLKNLEAHGRGIDASGGFNQQAIRELLRRVRWESPIYPRYVALLDAGGRVVDTNPSLPDVAAQDLIKNGEYDQALLNQVEMAIRAYDPCLSCATHELDGRIPVRIHIVSSCGETVATVAG